MWFIIEGWCRTSQTVRAGQRRRFAAYRYRGVVVYIKSPAVRVVFQLWKSVFQLRNKGFFWGNGGVYYNRQSDFVFMLAHDNYFTTWDICVKQSRPRTIWWAWQCFHYNPTLVMRSDTKSTFLKGDFLGNKEVLGKRPCCFLACSYWYDEARSWCPAWFMMKSSDFVRCPTCPLESTIFC